MDLMKLAQDTTDKIETPSGGTAIAAMMHIHTSLEKAFKAGENAERELNKECREALS